MKHFIRYIKNNLMFLCLIWQFNSYFDTIRLPQVTGVSPVQQEREKLEEKLIKQI